MLGRFANTYSFSSRLINEATFGVSDTLSHGKPAANPATWKNLGIPAPLQGQNGIGLEIGSTDLYTAFDQAFQQFTLNGVDTLSYTRGKHSLRMGAGITHMNIDAGG